MGYLFHVQKYIPSRHLLIILDIFTNEKAAHAPLHTFLSLIQTSSSVLGGHSKWLSEMVNLFYTGALLN